MPQWSLNTLVRCQDNRMVRKHGPAAIPPEENPKASRKATMRAWCRAGARIITDPPAMRASTSGCPLRWFIACSTFV